MSIIAAGTSSGTALVSTGDTNGTLVIQTNGTTVAATFGTDQSLTLVGATTFAAGSAAAPSLTTTGDTNTGVFFPAADTVGVATGGSERVRVDSSGNVGIGTTVNSVYDQVAAARPLVVQKSDTNTTLNASLANITIVNGDTTTNNSAQLNFAAITGASTNQYASASISTIFGVRTNTVYPSGNLAFSTSTATQAPVERMRIESSGIVLVGATTARTTEAKLELRSAANTALSLYMFKDTQVEATLGFKSSTDSNFYVGSGSTSVGTYGVYLTNTGSSWNSVSDERMKTIVEPIENASAKVATLRAVIGYYNNDERQIRRPFLIAQDVQAVLPEAVNIQDVETGTLGMSYTDTIPLLVAAIKELKAEFDAYKAAHP